MTEQLKDRAGELLCAGDEMFPAMLAAIDAARESVCLEMYTFVSGPLGDKFRDALVRARNRGLTVRVLLDSFGSVGLPGGYWRPLVDAGGEVRFFNPLSLKRIGIRNHRKLLVCDSQIAFVGGFNISPDYEGDGVSRGWCDMGLQLAGTVAARLASSFDEMWDRAELRHKRFPRLRKSQASKTIAFPHEQVLLSGPGRGRNPIKQALRRDFSTARDVQIIMAYFLPTWSIRRELARIARSGGSVQLVLPGKSDVALAQLAGRSLYRRLLRSGVRIFEYQPQILHTKLIVIDNVVYLGSANLDQRSLAINYELMIRLDDAGMADRARRVVQGRMTNSVEITNEAWTSSRSLWRRIKHRWAYFVLMRIDPYVARWQWRAIPD